MTSGERPDICERRSPSNHQQIPAAMIKREERFIVIFFRQSYKIRADRQLLHVRLICIEYHIHYLLLLVKPLRRLV